MKRLLIALLLVLVAGVAWAQVPGTSPYGIMEAVSGAFTQSGDTTIAPSTPVVLDNATGDEVAFDQSFTVNKATSGTTYGTYVNMINTASPGNGYLGWWGVDDVAKMSITDSGNFVVTGNVYAGASRTVYSDAFSSRSTNANMSLNPNGTGIIDLRTSGGPVSVGDGTYSWGHAPTGLGVEGSSEFDLGVVFNGPCSLTGSNTLYIGGATDLTYAWQRIRLSNYMLGLGANVERNMLIVDGSMNGKDFDHAVSTDPTTIWHSALDPDTNNTRWGSLHHDGTAVSDGDLWIKTGSGGIVLDPAANTDIVLIDGIIHTAVRDQHMHMKAGAVGLGPTAPSTQILGTFFALGFDADNEHSAFQADVPSDWVGGTSDDWVLRIAWTTNSAGDVIADGETVKHDIDYRCVAAAEGALWDAGSAVTITGTYTQTGNDTDKSIHFTDIAIDADHADQPLVYSYGCGFDYSRDLATDTYSGEIYVLQWILFYDSDKLAEH